MPSALTKHRRAAGSRADRAPLLHRALPEAIRATPRSASDADAPTRAARRIFDPAARLGV